MANKETNKYYYFSLLGTGLLAMASVVIPEITGFVVLFGVVTVLAHARILKDERGAE